MPFRLHDQCDEHCHLFLIFDHEQGSFAVSGGMCHRILVILSV